MTTPNWNSTIGTMVLGFTVCAMGAFFFILLGKGFQKARTTVLWDEVPATVTASWIEQSQFNENTGPRFRPRLRYAYSYNGDTFSGNRIKPNDKKSKERNKIEAILAPYPVDASITAFVNPEDPDESVLEHDTRAPGYSMWFPALFMVGGFGISITALIKKLKRR